METSFAAFTLGEFWGWVCGRQEEPAGDRGFVWGRRGAVDKETWGAGHHVPSLASALSHLPPGVKDFALTLRVLSAGPAPDFQLTA